MARSLVVMLTALCVAGSAHFAAAQSLPWNQEVVTARAGELEDAVSGLRDAVRQSPNWQIPSQRRRLYEIVENLRLIEQAATSLHAELKKGEGMESTLPTYKHLQQVRRDTVVVADRVDISAVTKPKLDKANDLLKKIEPYYPVEPLAPGEKPPEAK
jgi:hypothetical protein